MIRLLAPLALVSLLVAIAAGCGGDEDGSAAASGATSGGQTEATAGGCTAVEKPAPHDDGSATPPKEPLDPARRAALEFVTNCGSFTVTLDVKGAPKTAASLVALARSGFFEDTIFHRIVPGFVIQGGDPTQSGSGGPGYQTVDLPPQDATYTKGVVAMAKTATEPAGTSGSQFFIVTGADIGLPAEYAIVGTVTAGLDVIERIGALGNELEEPTEPVVVSDVAVTVDP